MRNKFINPANAHTFVWPANHTSERRVEQTRKVQHSPTVAAGWRDARDIHQQGATTPLRLELEGTLYAQEDVRWFSVFHLLCREQTIHFQHATGELYEALITRFEPRRERVARNLRGGFSIWRYTLELEVIRQLN